MALTAHLTENKQPDEEQVYTTIANRLADLIDDVREVRVDRDERRELLTLLVTGRDNTPHPARALSDGTLRFLALAAIDIDPLAQGVLCLEEPENGIHPARIPAILRLLQDIATDTQYAVGEDNPLRQVIVNTHSPAFVSQVPDDCLVVAERGEGLDKEGNRFTKVAFGSLRGTWREKAKEYGEAVTVIPKASVLGYLNPNGFAGDAPYLVSPAGESDRNGSKNGTWKNTRRGSSRIMDRPDLRNPVTYPNAMPKEKVTIS